MEWRGRGVVKGGTIIFSDAVALPEGVEVAVHVELWEEPSLPSSPANGEFQALPCFGMWADRKDMADNVAWVNEERAQWHRRANRQD